MKIYLAQRGDKQPGLHFVGDPEPEDLYEQIKSWVSCNAKWIEAPFHKESKKAGPFIQSDCSDYLFIEFWGIEMIGYVTALLKEFNLELSPPEEFK